MNTKNTNNSLFQKDQLKASLKQSFVKLNPRLMVKNPIMFTVEIATFFMLPVTVYSAVSGAQGSVIYNFSVFVILFLTLLLPTLRKPSPKHGARLRLTACAKLVRKHLPSGSQMESWSL